MTAFNYLATTTPWLLTGHIEEDAQVAIITHHTSVCHVERLCLFTTLKVVAANLAHLQ